METFGSPFGVRRYPKRYLVVLPRTKVFFRSTRKRNECSHPFRPQAHLRASAIVALRSRCQETSYETSVALPNEKRFGKAKRGIEPLTYKYESYALPIKLFCLLRMSDLYLLRYDQKSALPTQRERSVP